MKLASPQKDLFYFFLKAGLLAIPLFLTVISWMRLCSQACAEGHSYRLFGFTFEAVGLLFFSTIILTHLLSYRFTVLSLLTNWMLCAALGAEVVFIYVQKYKIGSWCPICLSIAAILLIANIAVIWSFYSRFKKDLQQGDGEQTMNTICKGMTGIIFFMMGFVSAFTGVGKLNPLQAVENNVKESLAFGNLYSPIEVYIFTDWACPACRALETTLESISTAIMPNVKLTFVDDPVHSETLNYTPYNLSFMINNKSNYLNLRSQLSKLSEDTENPTQAQIQTIAATENINYKQLNYADVALASKYFDHLVKKLDVIGTPTLVVVNTKTSKAKKLEGSTEITRANVMKAIQSLNSGG